MNNLFKFFGKPRTIQNQINNRKISWLELFYDLIFAVVLSKLTDSLIEHLSWRSFGFATLIFVWLIWGWNEISGYFDNHGNNSLINIFLIDIEMILTGVAALFIPEAVNGNFNRITIVFMLIELLMALIWFILSFFDRLHGPASKIWAGIHVLSLAIMLIGYFNSYILIPSLVVALVLNIIVVFIANPWLEKEYQHAHLIHQIKDSMIERYGSITMISLGEIIAGFYETLHSTSGEAIINLVVSIVLISLLAAIYYQVLGSLAIQLSSSIATGMTGWLFIFSILCTYYLGASSQLILRSVNSLTYHLFFAGSLILFMVAIRFIVLIGKNMNKSQRLIINVLLFIEGIITLLLAFLPTTLMLISISVVLLAIILQGLVIE